MRFGLALSLLALTAAANAQVTAIWQRTWIDSRESTAVDGVLSSDGGVVVAGTISTVGGYAALVVKYSATGGLVWSREIPSPDGGITAVSGIGQDSSGNFYVGGHSYRGATNDTDLLWIKLTSSGQVISYLSYDLNAGSADLVAGFSVRGDGVSALIGNAWKGAISTGFIYRLSNSGTILQSASVDEGPLTSDEITACFIRPTGDIFTAGTSYRSGNRSVPFIAGLPSTGSPITQFSVHPGVPNDAPRALAVDSFGDVVLGGQHGLLPKFASYYSRAPQSTLQGPQNHVFTGSTSESNLTDIAISTADVAYATGTQEQPDGSTAAFIANLGLTAIPTWVQTYGSPLRDETPLRITLDPLGPIYLAGRADRAVSGQDFWVLKTTSLGSIAYDYRWSVTGSRQQGEARKVIIAGNKQVYVVGNTPSSSGKFTQSVVKLSENSEIRFQFNALGMNPDWSLLPLQLVVTNQATNATLFSGQIFASATGTFSISNVPDATYRIRVTAPNMLNRQLQNFFVVGGSPLATLSLAYGDVDLDQEITILDYLLLSAAFESSLGEAAWNPNADFDRDESITILDYIALSTAFERTGDF